MRNTIQCMVSIVSLSAGSIFGAACHAEIRDLSPVELHQAASHVFSGKVARNYSTIDRSSPSWEYTYSVAELQVMRQEKAEHTGSLAYIRFWRKRYVGKGDPPPGAYGHRNVPEVGEITRVFVTTADDGGYDVVSPNGFVPLSSRESQ